MTSNALFANVKERTVKGLLLPFGEPSRYSASGEDPVTFAKGSIALPRDPSVVGLNVQHDRYSPVGRATELEETDAGIVATFSIANTDEGDDVLNGIASGRLSRLSAEVAGLIRRGADAVRSKLTGSALVDEGAFASAALFAIGDVIEATNEQVQTAPAPEKPYPAFDSSSNLTAVVGPDGVVGIVNDTPAPSPADPAQPVGTADGDTATNQTTSETPEANQEKEDVMTDVIIPDGVSVETPADKKPDTSLGALFAAMSYAKKSGDRSVLEPFAGGNVDFAIATIQNDGPSGRTISADTAQPAYLGELWKGLTYERKYWPLVSNAPLTSFRVVGWRWATAPEVAAYSGNTAEVPSNAVDTEPVSADARRIAGGHRLDRRFYDFNDQEVIASYFRLMAESYAKVSDADILSKIVAAATTTTPGTVPTGVPKGLAALVDGALDVVGQDNTPTFAIVSPELYRDILFLGKDDTFAYLDSAFSIKREGNLAGFQIRTGNVGTGKVVVGSKEAMTAFELPGSPIRVEAVAPHHGAFDDALYGYIAHVVHNSAAIRTVTVV